MMDEDRRKSQSEWLQFRDIMAKGIVVSKYSHSILNSMRSSKTKKWKFRRLTIKENGFLDWQTNCILLNKVKKIKCGQKTQILHTEELRCKSLTLFTKKRDIVFQFKTSQKRDEYLFNLLHYLSLCPFDHIRSIPTNLDKVKNLFPVRNKWIIIKLKRVDQLQKILMNLPKQCIKNDDDLVLKSAENQKNEKDESNEQNIAMQSAEENETNNEPVSVDISSCELSHESDEKADEILSDDNVQQNTQNEIVEKMVEARLEEYCGKFTKKLLIMEEKYEKAVETLKKCKRENDGLKEKLKNAQKYQLVAASPTDSVTQTEAALEVLDREIQNSMMRIDRLSGSHKAKSKSPRHRRSRSRESLENDGDALLTKLLLLKQKSIAAEKRRTEIISRNPVSWK